MNLVIALVVFAGISLFCVAAMLRQRNDSPHARARRHHRHLDNEMIADRERADGAGSDDS